MRTLHQNIHHHLKLQHHQHTGKLLHHKHTSYRALAVIFALTGLAMTAVTVAGRVAADSLVAVQATVPPPIPATSAIITQPVDGAHLTNNSLLIVGSCPIVTPQVVVQVLVDNTSVGSAACDSNNDFSVPTTLSLGSHLIVAKTFTIAGRGGPASGPVRITTPSSTVSKASPVIVTANAPLSYLGADKTSTWAGTISGGTPPYHIRIDWSDGKQVTVTNSGGPQSFEHNYFTLASYNPLITVADSAGHATSQQFAVGAYMVAAPKINPASYTTTAVTPKTLLGLYGMLITAISVSGIIWLEAKHAARHEAAW